MRRQICPSISSLSLAVTLLLGSACATQIEEVDCLENPELGICEAADATTNNSPARIYVDPPFGVSFSCVLLGCNETRTLTIESKGSGSLGISRIVIDSEQVSDFSAALLREDAEGNLEEIDFPSADSPLILPPRTTAQLTVQYIPTDGIEDLGTLKIDWYDGYKSYDDAVVETLELNVSARFLGDATGALVSDRLNFGYAPIGDTTTLFVEVQNTSTSDVILSALSASLTEESSPAFELGMGWDGFANPGDTIKIPVTFTPSANEASYGKLVLETNDLVGYYEIDLMGTAIEHALLQAIEPADHVVDFGEVFFGQLRTRTMLLRNAGGQATTFTAEVTAGADQGFTLLDAGPFTLGPLDEQLVTIELNAQLGGPLSGNVTIVPEEITDEPAAEESVDEQDTVEPAVPAEPISVYLYAECSAPAATPSTTTLGFSPLVEGWTSDPMVVEVANTGTGELIISSVSFDVGSSEQIQIATGLTLPVILRPEDPPIEIPVMMFAAVLGDVTGALLIQTNSIDNDVIRVDIAGSVVTCEEGCPIANGAPDCSSGECGVASCIGGWHDTDLTASTGCECQEDRGGNDIGGVCSTRYDLGTLGDGCSSYPSQQVVQGTLHTAEDTDLFFARTEDTWAAFCDTFGDSSESSVELVDGPPGLVLCAVIREVESGCGGYTNYFDPGLCGSTRYSHDGSYGTEDSKDITAWVMWHPDAAPSCGTYTVKFRGED